MRDNNHIGMFDVLVMDTGFCIGYPTTKQPIYMYIYNVYVYVYVYIYIYIYIYVYITIYTHTYMYIILLINLNGIKHVFDRTYLIGKYIFQYLYNI